MHVILVEPQIPQNTGNIVRTCAATGSRLTLVEPLGFRISDRKLKRAGLDYWLGVNVQVAPSLSDYLKGSFFFFSSKATRSYTDVSYTPDTTLIFGSETTGLPAALLSAWPDRALKIPMVSGTRCLNLSNSVAIVLYEAWRQLCFA